MSLLRLLPAAVLGLAGCAHTPDSSADGTTNVEALRTAARAVVRSVASKPVKVAMTAERVGEKALGKLAENTDDAGAKTDEPAP